MPVKIRWLDNASLDAGHYIYRKPVNDTAFTVIANLTDRTPPETGVIEYTDTDELVPGDYTYKVDNYTQSGTTGGTTEKTVSIIDQSLHELCLGLKQNTVDSTKTHTISAINVTTVPASGAAFTNSHLSTETPIDLHDEFTISFDVYSDSTDTTDSTILISKDTTITYYSCILTSAGGLVFNYTTPSSSVNNITIPSSSILDDVFTNIHITGSVSSNELKIYTAGELINTSTFSGIKDTSADTTTVFGSDSGSNLFKGYLRDISIINGQVTVPSLCPICAQGIPVLSPPTNVQIQITGYPGAESILIRPGNIEVTSTVDTYTGLFSPGNVSVNIT